MISGIPDTVLVALIAVAGVFVGAIVAVLGHLVLARSAQQNRAWVSVWPKKAAAYEQLLHWSQGSSELTDTEVWVLAQAYGSDGVRKVISDYLKDVASPDDSPDDSPESLLGAKLGDAIRDDLGTTTKLK